MTEKIYYHNDTDGVLSAAAYILLKNVGDYVLKPMETSKRSSFQKEIYANGSVYKTVSLDFAYVDGLSYWCDHHRINGDIKISDEAEVLYDPDAKSAAGLLLKQLADKTILPWRKNRYLKLIGGIDMVDSASYPSKEFYVSDKSPIMALYRLISFSNQPTDSIVRSLVHSKLNIKDAIHVYSKPDHLSLLTLDYNFELDGDVSIYIEQIEHTAPPRYTEYFQTEANASIRIIIDSNYHYRVYVSKNPWSDARKDIDFSNLKLNSAIRWGGHKDIAGGLILEKDKFNIINEILEVLNV